MYSEHGFEPRMAPSAGQVCQALTVSWNWMPGSAQAQAAWPIWSHRSRARRVFVTFPSRRRVSSHSPSASTARRKPSVTRIELLEFWPETEA
jgi:hypothetical protein